LWPAQTAEGLKTQGLPGQLPDESVSYEVVFQLVQSEKRPSQSVVSGTLLGVSDGMTVALRGAGMMFSMRLAAAGVYRFEQLPAGQYILELEGSPVAADIMVDGTANVTVPTVDVRPNRKGIIEGRTLDSKDRPQPNVTVTLLLNEEAEQLAASDADGRYRFSDLGPGTYVVQAGQPATRSTPITLDGTQVVVLDLRLPDASTTKAVQHYLLFGPSHAACNRTNFRLAGRYILARGVSAGFVAEEAAQAEQVTIIGDEAAVSREVEQNLRDAGCQVGRLDGDSYAVADGLARLLEE